MVYRSITKIVLLSLAGIFLLLGCTTSPTTQKSTVYQGFEGIFPDPALQALLPRSYANDGFITVATDPKYPPMEYDSPLGLQGADIDLTKAIADTLGMQVKFTSLPYSTIVPAVAIGRFKLGASSLWATDDQAAMVNMITYYQASTQFITRIGPNAPKNTELGLCGHIISVEEGTDLVDTLASTSKKCLAAKLKPLVIQAFDQQDLATDALLTGAAEVTVSDSSVMLYVVAKNPSTVALLGPGSNVRPYGFATPPTDLEWSHVIQQTVQKLITTGTYQKILSKWHLEKGAIPTSTILPAHQSTP